MAKFRVTDPNTGRTLVLTGDSPPTQAELEEIFGRFQVKPVQPAVEQVAQDVGPLEAALIGVGRGMTTVGRGLGLVKPETPSEAAAFEALKEERPITTGAGEIVGQVAPFAPLGTVAAIPRTVAGRVAAATPLGAFEAGTIARGETDDQVETLKAGGLGAAVAGGLEVALPVIGRVAGPIVRRFLGKEPTAPLLDAAGNPSLELSQALDRAGLTLDDIAQQTRQQLQTGDIADPAALARRDFLEQQGITPTRAQVTGEASDFQTQQELAKTSGRVRRALEGQEEQLGKNFENAITATGGSANRSNSPVVDYIADRSIDLDKAISDAYTAAREAAPVEKVVRPDQLVEQIRAVAGSDRATGGLASATRDILRNRGVLAPGRGLKIQGRVDANTAEEIRKDLNALYDSLTPFGQSKLAELKNALDDDVAEAVGEDVFSEARAAKAQFESELRRAKVNKFDTRKQNLVRDILENKVDPDRFLDVGVLNKGIRADDVKQLKTFLLQDGSDEGIQAWNDLRAEALLRIKNQAFKEVGGEAALSRAGLENILERFGSGKIRQLFNEDERRFLTDMVKVAQLREPKRGTALGRGPSAQAISRLESVVKRIPLISNVFEGIGTDLQGRVVLRQPGTRAPLPPSPATGVTTVTAPAAAPAIVEDENQ